eukprot:6173806-Pleurochrysis_carterae.AAC.1
MPTVKTAVSSWIKFAAAELERRLGPWFASSASFPLRSAVNSILDVFKGLHTSALEEASLKKSVPCVQSRESVLGVTTHYVTDKEGFTYSGRIRTDYCYDMLMSETIGRLLRYDKRALDQIYALQREWRKIPPKRGFSKFVAADIPGDSNFREHPELDAAMGGQIPAADEPVQLAIGLHYDS